MRAIRVDHRVEGFPQSNQSIHEALGPLVMHVVIAGTVYEEKLARQPLRKVDG
jgi:hypothetical protein